MVKKKYKFWVEISASDRNVKSKKYSICQIQMDPKNKSSVINSRGTFICHSCGLKLNRHAHKITITHTIKQAANT